MAAHEARERSAYWRAGLVASAVINAHGGKTKPDDFVPQKRKHRPAAQTPAQMANALKAMTLMMGGTING